MPKTVKSHSLKTIAEELGFSKAAVSLVLNGKGSKVVSRESERRILEFCREVNYRPNIHARRMNSRQVKNVGVLLNHGNPLSEFNTAEIAGGVALEAELAGYRMTIQLCREGMNPESIFDWLRDREVDGLIYYGVSLPKDWLATLSAERRLVVGIGIEPQKGLRTVNIDNRQMSARLVGHLFERGAEDFIFLSGGESSYPNSERKAGFLDALKARRFKLRPDAVVNCDFKMELARETVERLSDAGRLPSKTAIVCANDAMAVGALAGLKGRGRRVPQEIFLAGCDNIMLGSVTEPAITTYDYLAFQQGQEAFKLLLRMIMGESSAVQDIVLASHLVLRSST